MLKHLASSNEDFGEKDFSYTSNFLKGNCLDPFWVITLPQPNTQIKNTSTNKHKLLQWGLGKICTRSPHYFDFPNFNCCNLLKNHLTSFELGLRSHKEIGFYWRPITKWAICKSLEQLLKSWPGTFEMQLVFIICHFMRSLDWELHILTWCLFIHLFLTRLIRGKDKLYQCKQTYPCTLLWKTFASSTAIAAPTWPNVGLLSTLKRKKNFEKIEFHNCLLAEDLLYFKYLVSQHFSPTLPLLCEFAAK